MGRNTQQHTTTENDAAYGVADQVLSTRSVVMTLGRPFKAGKWSTERSRRVATSETRAQFNRRYATRTGDDLIPALKRPANFIPTLRVEDLASFIAALLQL